MHTHLFTSAWVPDRRFGRTKPVYVLISRQTFSAAEAFAYDVKALKRVNVVGERSGGEPTRSGIAVFTSIFVLSLPEERSINPLTDGTGREPE